MDLEIRKSKSISIFKNNFLKLIRPRPNRAYYCHNPKEIMVIASEHNFKYRFQDCFNPVGLYSNDIEISNHYLLHCSTYAN